MDNARLLECLDVDFARVRELAHATDPAAPVPSCPGWTMDDLIRHVATVYLHKVGSMREGADLPWPPTELDLEKTLDLLERGHRELLAEFAGRAPQDYSFTWYGPDQTVGFWIRRMAQETVIHRVDAELAAGVPVSAIPDDLAEDGIDEFLNAFVDYGAKTWPDYTLPLLAGTDGGAVLLESPGSRWLIQLRPDGLTISATLRAEHSGSASDVDGATAAAAQVRADARSLLLWLWGRVTDDQVSISGDEALVRQLRPVLAEAAQ